MVNASTISTIEAKKLALMAGKTAGERRATKKSVMLRIRFAACAV
jgi:hypothetical protein